MDASRKKHYSDHNGANVIHMYTPFSYAIGERYDYLRTGWLHTALYYLFHSLVIAILWLYLPLANGFRIRGRENIKCMRGKGVIVVSNHVHVMDCPMISCAIGLRRMYSVTAASNFCIPVIRHLVRGLGGVPLDDSPVQVKRLFSEMEKALQKGRAVLVYPEGVLIPYYEGIRTFKRGAFKMAAEADVPVLPVVVTFRQPKGIWKRIRKRPFATLTALSPMYPDTSLPARARGIELEESCAEAMRAAAALQSEPCSAVSAFSGRPAGKEREGQISAMKKTCARSAPERSAAGEVN